jgi:2-deoxy-D-gluconate 3-dehydrogenase
MNNFNFFNLYGKKAIITGGVGLIGSVYTSALLKMGAEVIIFDKKFNQKEFCKKLITEYKVTDKEIKKLDLIKCDITNENEVKSNFLKIKKQLKNLKILINNASLVKQVGNDELKSNYKAFLHSSKKDWQEFFDVDLIGSLLMSKNAIPFMIKNGGGVIINISSTYGINGPDQRIYNFFNSKLTKKQKERGMFIEKPIGYSISKSGILNLTRHLASQFGKNNIRVNTLTLGGVYYNNPKEFVKEYSKKTMLGRMANKIEYAGPMMFLISDASAYMTGSNLIVDGGWTAW